MWLTQKDLQQTEPAEIAAFRSPIPTQMISNGEFLPALQTVEQRQVEEQIKSLADVHGRKLGLSRRRFLQTSCGMAAAFLAMNSVYGSLFQVEAAEAADPQAAGAHLKDLRHQFIFDDQVHFVRDDFTWEPLLGLGEFAKAWNPRLKEQKLTLQRYKFENFVKEIFMDSQTTVGLLSGAPSRLQLSEHILGSGPDVLKQACKMGLEGVLSKRIDRPYRAGRGHDWLKVKCVQNDEFVIGGYSEPSGSRAAEKSVSWAP